MHNRWVVLAGFLILCLGVGAIAGGFTAQAVTAWYPTLAKPPFNPPNSVFGPVWTILYVMMAVAGWAVWERGRDAKPALNLFFVQLALNFAWSFFFFGLQRPALALIDIIALWIAILLTIRAFLKLRPAAGWAMVPYLAWVSFATYLNAGIWWLN